MHVVWHDDEFVKGDMGKMHGNTNPVLMGDSPHRRHVHFTVHHLAEERFAVMRTDGDEISTGGRIVPAAQTRAFNPIFVPKERHSLAHAFSLSRAKNLSRLPTANQSLVVVISRSDTSNSPEISLGRSRSRVRQRFLFFIQSTCICRNIGETMEANLSKMSLSG